MGTIQYRKSSLYQEVAIDFVPVDEGKVNADRAKDYFPIRKACLLYTSTLEVIVIFTVVVPWGLIC